MPYVLCAACGSRVYSAAMRANVDECPVCATPLPLREDKAVPGARSAPRPAADDAGQRTQATLTAIEERLGRVPGFFESAIPDPDALRELWHLMRVFWLESSVPPEVRHVLLQSMASQSPWPWRVIAHDVLPSDEGLAPPGIEQVLAAGTATDGRDIRMPVPAWPAPGTAEFSHVVALSLKVATNAPDAEARRTLKTLLGNARYASLIGVLTFLQAARTFAEARPDTGEATVAQDLVPAEERGQGILEVDGWGLIRFVSQIAQDLFGWSAASILGRPVWSLFLSDGRDRLTAFIHDATVADNVPLREQALRLTARREAKDPVEVDLTLVNRLRDGGAGGVTIFVRVAREPRVDAPAGFRLLRGLLSGDSGQAQPPALLDAIADTLGWEHVLVWRFDPEAARLRCVASNVGDGTGSNGESERAAVTFGAGEGIVGRVFESGTAAWASLLPDDVGSTGLERVRSGLWLPFGAGAQPEGVLELLSTDVRPADAAVLELVAGLRPAAADPARASRPGADTGRQLAFEGAPAAMALCSVDTDEVWRLSEVNPAMCTLTGYEAGELIGRSMDDLTEPEDVALDRQLVVHLLAGRIPSYEVQKRFRRADGSRFWGELSASVVRTPETRAPVHLVLQLTDVSERKRVEDALHDSRARLASVFDEAPIGMAIATLDGRWLQVNPACCDTFGYTEAELLTQRLADVIAPEDVETVYEYLRQLVNAEVLGYHMETRAICADGEQIWIQLSMSLIHDYEGAPAYLLAEVQDVTERKHLEHDLEQGALRDPTTGFPSRALLFDRLEQAIARFERDGVPLVVMFVRVNGAETLNARLGSDCANSAIREMAARLLAAVRVGDTIGRYGPDEFVVICEGLADQSEADGTARRLRELGRLTVGKGKAAIQLDVSVGMTVASRVGTSATETVQRAATDMRAVSRNLRGTNAPPPNTGLTLSQIRR
jgi:PAS domain S-box-containing protein/diguanylate cyclase (GGDEF)-like protein